MTRPLFLAALLIFLVLSGCGNTSDVRDAAYFKANPEKREQYMETVDKHLKALAEQVEKGHITIEEYDSRSASLLESPAYKAAREAAGH